MSGVNFTSISRYVNQLGFRCGLRSSIRCRGMSSWHERVGLCEIVAVLHISCLPFAHSGEQSLLAPSLSPRTFPANLASPCCRHAQTSMITPRLVWNVPLADAQSVHDEISIGDDLGVEYFPDPPARPVAETPTVPATGFSCVQRAAWLMWSVGTAVWVTSSCLTSCSPPSLSAPPSSQRTPPLTPERPHPGHTSP